MRESFDRFSAIGILHRVPLDSAHRQWCLAGLTDPQVARRNQPTEVPARTCEEGTFRSHDGIELFYRYWPAASPRPRGAIVLLHRGHEHSGRVAHLVDELGLENFAFFAWDARGHGRSPGARGFSPSLAASVRDLQTFVDHIASRFDFAVNQIAVVAQSVGAMLAATWVHDYAPGIRCMVLASPAFKIRLYVPFALHALRLLHAIRGNFFVNSYVKPGLLSHDPGRSASYERDPLIARAISVNILLGLHAAAARVINDAAAILVPTQLLISGRDWVVHRQPQLKFFDRLGTCRKEKHILEGFYHDTLGELRRAPVIAKARSFLLSCFAEEPEEYRLLDADEEGYTKSEADELARQISPYSAAGLYWSAWRLALKIGGRLSHGIRLGQESGFDSGSTLDYVYCNRPQSRSFVGRAIDRAYLNAIGWRSIRQRKSHVERLLQVAIAKLRETGRPIRIVDVAAGHGRYVLDALAGVSPAPESIRLYDSSEVNVARGAALIAQRGLSSAASFALRDAFDVNSQICDPSNSTIGIVSGLYELFSDNDLVRRSLTGLAAAIPAGGFLVYTNQPWHPQLRFIARVLTSHRNGQAWVMRRRTQAEMDQLVEAAGFDKVEQRIDDNGIFTVSLARRRAA